MKMLFLYCVSLIFEIAGAALASVCGACSVLAEALIIDSQAVNGGNFHSADMSGGFDHSLSAPRPA
jgi:hypothetical protein